MIKSLIGIREFRLEGEGGGKPITKLISFLIKDCYFEMIPYPVAKYLLALVLV